jgi:hypothetical protein
MFVQGIVDACSDRDPLGRHTMESVALVALSVAFGAWAVATAAAMFHAVAVCGD